MDSPHGDRDCIHFKNTMMVLLRVDDKFVRDGARAAELIEINGLCPPDASIQCTFRSKPI